MLRRLAKGERCHHGVMADVTGSRTSRAARWLAWLIGLAALSSVIVLVTHFSQEKAIARMFERAQPGWLGLALALQSLTYFSEAQIWRGLIRKAGGRLSSRLALQLSLAKLFIDQTLPSGGISGALFVVEELISRGIRRAAALAGIAVATFSYYGAYVACLSVAVTVAAVHHSLHSSLLWVVVTFVVASATLCALLIYILRRRPLPFESTLTRVPVIRRTMEELHSADWQLVRDGGLLGKAMGWQAAIFALDYGTLWLCLLATGIVADPAAIFASYIFSSLFRSLAILPGGLGVFEAASVLTLRAAGVSVAEGLTATLLFRGLSFWLPLVPGLLAAARVSKRVSPFTPPLQSMHAPGES